MKQAGFLAMPWVWIAVGLALLLVTGWAMAERQGRQAQKARAEALESSVETYAGLLEQRDEQIRKQNAAVKELQAKASRLLATTKSAIAAAQAEARQERDTAAALRSRLEASEGLSCEAGVDVVKTTLH